MQSAKKHLKRASLIAVGALILLTCGRAAFSAGAGTQPLITAAIDENALVTLAGNTRPEATAANDRGPVAADFPLEHMILQLRRSPAEESALEKFLDELEDPKSPNYHQWMTAQQFGDRYGLAEQDLAKIAGWLQAHGLTVNRTYPNGMMIDFSGNAGNVREAFHTEIHNLAVNGAAHIANMSDPQIPAALAPAVAGVVSLNDFRPHAMNRPRPAYTVNVDGEQANLVVPADLATIYNFNPLFTAGYSGQGQTIVVLEDSDLYKTSDWTTFRNVMGLASAYPEGSLSQLHPDGCSDPGINDADGEAEIDAEWSSAAAPNAAIEVAACADTKTTFGGFIAMTNLLNESDTPPAIISISYGQSEASDGATQNAYINSLYQQAVGEGVSVFVASGDEGAASSDADNATASHGIGVSGFTSTPYNVSVGGTDFGDTYANSNSSYWSDSNSPDYESALSYVPEIPWNDSCASALIDNYRGYGTAYGSSGFCNSTTGKDDFLEVVAGSGGPSGCATGSPSSSGVVGGSCAGYAKPSWQSIVGNPHDGVRDVPDVSLFAADGVWNHYYVICYSDPTPGYYGAPCTGAPSTWAGFGGTSFASPIMAGIQSLINQKTGSRQGNPNPTYYALADAEYGAGGAASCSSTLGNGAAGSCIFYDVTQGDIDVPCTGSHNCYTPSGKNGVLSTSDSEFAPAYPTGTGWDFATGIGTVNAYNLVMAFGATAPTSTPTPTPTATSTGATPTPTATPTGGAPTLTPTATPTSTPTGVPESLKVKPTSVNFGKVKVGHVASVTVKISNPAKHGSPITFGNPPAAVPSTSPQEFGFATNCPAQLLPKKKCKLTVLFAPSLPGPMFSTVTIYDNAANANQTIELQGTGK
ncbi:protease pro-enzyme activation domain-containing protein [Candidatus Binatus sp.]|uniref:protease pro-enzyme activation domain-containing protein n=1 Tax=Candidatus Binatus sp. TaxID=2811406 RepID=UPI003C996E07